MKSEIVKNPINMTPEEIKKLSEECALHYQGRPSNKGYELSNRLTIESYALMTLRWLSKDYCIIPKSKVKEWQCIVEEALKADRVITAPAFRFMWESLFGKDTFEEEGK